ncbi:MAG: isochorismatase family protein [bacterium]
MDEFDRVRIVSRFDLLGRTVSPRRKLGSVFLLGLILGAGWYRLQFFPIPQIASLVRTNRQVSVEVPDSAGESGGRVVLETRRLSVAQNEHVYDTERDSTYAVRRRPLDLHRTALVLIDVWARHPNDGWQRRAQEIIEESLVPLVDLARRGGMLIVHAPHGEPIAPLVAPAPEDVLLDDHGIASAAAFDRFLRRRGVDTLLYAGFASNWCLLTRPVGIRGMKELGYDVLLVRDASIAMESPRTISGQWAHTAAVDLIELHWGASTTLEHLREALTGVEDSGASPPPSLR